MSALLRDELNRDAHHVDVVPNGRDALDIVLGNDPPDLLITDGDMPEMGGLELCRRLRAQGASLPVIFITASADQLVDALDAGADDFVRKPFEPAELAARVRAALRARHLAGQLAAERDRTAALVSSLQDGLLVFDATGRIVEANTRIGAISGLDPGELVGLVPPFPFWPEERWTDYTRTLLDALERGEAIEADRVYRRADGVALDVIVSLAPVYAAIDARAPMYVSTVKDVTARRTAERALRESEARHRALAREQARLSRVAATVASSDDPDAVFALVAKEVAGLLGADAGGVTRFEDGSAVLVGGWTVLDSLRLPIGTPLPLDGNSATARVRREGRAVRIDDYASETDDWHTASATPHLSSVAAPVRVAGELWGTVGAISVRRGGFADGAEARLEEFASLVGVAVTGADARSELAMQALTDPLTGLVNRRGFTDRLEDEVAAASAQGGPLSLALFDLDHFKAVNDRHGHETGDAVLRELARRMIARRRENDMVARIGGEEFAVLLPGANSEAARAVSERIRRAVAATEFPVAGRCTISCGVARWRSGDDGAALLRRADVQLYRAKENGRNRVLAEEDAEG